MENDTAQDCTKRSITYETWCRTCERREEEIIEEKYEKEEERNTEKRKIKRYKYIGESSRSGYERGLEHIRDWKELKKESHMVKHYFSVHEGENPEEMEFHMRIIKTHRSAFNRQISESVEIQNQKKDHVILNSKSEYNRCALPRLTARVGEEKFSLLEKRKREDKEAEKDLERKIRNLKVKNSQNRREQLTSREQPAEKRRRLNKKEYMRVLQEKKEAKKRENESMDTNGEKEQEQEKTFPIFNKKESSKTNKKRKVEKDESTENKEQAGEERIPIDKKWTQEEWTERIKRRQERMDMEEKERTAKIEKAKRMEKSWELLRLCKEMMKRDGYNWKISKERREQERAKNLERKERLERAAANKEKTLEKIERKNIQSKITDRLNQLPNNRRILIEKEIEKERLLNLKEAKEEIWKKWRQTKGRRRTNPHKKQKMTENESLEEKLSKIEKAVEEYQLELEKIEEQKKEKDQRIERKKRMEKHWEMLRWIIKFMEENDRKWKELKKLRQTEREEQEKKEKWEAMTREEKMQEIEWEKFAVAAEKSTRKEERLKEAQRLKSSWNKWQEQEDQDEEYQGELEHEDYLKGTEELCLQCLMTPCYCDMVLLERRMEMHRLEKLRTELAEKIQAHKEQEHRLVTVTKSPINQEQDRPQERSRKGKRKAEQDLQPHNHLEQDECEAAEGTGGGVKNQPNQREGTATPAKREKLEQ